MTRRQFIRLAEYLTDILPYCEPFTVRQIDHLANFCHEQNPRFNRQRWLALVNARVGYTKDHNDTPIAAHRNHTL